MKNQITRRDFLKLAGMFPLSFAVPNIINALHPMQLPSNPENVIIIVFDAFSAYHISLLGYQRETTPNLDRLAERAIVYHNHYSNANFTTPATASLFTGTLPWTHRGFHVKETVKSTFVDKNIFTAFQNYYRVAYSHNYLVNVLEKQFQESLDNLLPQEALFMRDTFDAPTFLEKDEDIFTVGWLRNFDKRIDGNAYSLFFSTIFDAINKKIEAKYAAKYASLKQQFPRGVPGKKYECEFLLEEAIDWFQENLGILPKPFMGYFHFLPPHDPYSTRREFYEYFKDDGVVHKLKPRDIFARSELLEENRLEFENRRRMMYDEFILYVDSEFGRLFDYLDRSGQSEDTWVVLTSDHGEMFERGVLAHGSYVLYEPVIRIPLMIFEPGRKTRLDVHTPTSAIDVLPTMLHVTGQSPAGWAEGIVLPPFSSTYPDRDRSIFAVEAQRNKSYAPLTVATTALAKGGYKLMYSFGYKELAGEERVELYHIESDPEELNDLHTAKRETTSEMLNELKTKLAEVNEPFL